MNELKENDYYIGQKTSRVSKEDYLIDAGVHRADKIYENIMNEYATSGWYNDETHTIASSQFLSLFHYFADCLVDCGYNQDDLNSEISSVIAWNEKKQEKKNR